MPAETVAAPGTQFVPIPAPIPQLEDLSPDVDLLGQSAEAAGDPLSLMLLLMERAAQSSMQNAEVRIQETRNELKAELQHYLKQVEEALRAIQKAKEDDGGWFSNLVSSIAKIAGKILGPLVENSIEVVKFQADLVIDVGQSVVQGQNLLDNMRQTSFALADNGQITADVRGCVAGAARFAADLSEFLATASAIVARAALTGEDVAAALAPHAEALHASLERNILENPQFWAVVQAAGTGASVVATGGLATPLAVIAFSLMAVQELDRQIGFLDKYIPEAATEIRIVIGVGIGLCQTAAALNVSTSELASSMKSQELARLLSTATGLAAGAQQVYGAAKSLIEGNRHADDLDRAAEQLATLQSMQRLQRLLEQLLDTLEADTEDHTRTRQLGQDLVATEAATEAAVIIPA